MYVSLYEYVYVFVYRHMTYVSKDMFQKIYVDVGHGDGASWTPT